MSYVYFDFFPMFPTNPHLLRLHSCIVSVCNRQQKSHLTTHVLSLQQKIVKQISKDVKEPPMVIEKNVFLRLVSIFRLLEKNYEKRNYGVLLMITRQWWGVQIAEKKKIKRSSIRAPFPLLYFCTDFISSRHLYLDNGLKPLSF